MNVIPFLHYNNVIMSAIAFQITGVSIVCSTVCWGVDQRKYQSSASLAFGRGIHRFPVNFPRKGPVSLKMFPCNDIIRCDFFLGGDFHHSFFLMNPFRLHHFSSKAALPNHCSCNKSIQFPQWMSLALVFVYYQTEPVATIHEEPSLEWNVFEWSLIGLNQALCTWRMRFCPE